MATEAQILANRRNAKKSTGPRTKKGKVIVSQNAFRHSLSAGKNVISSENQADFKLYHNKMLTELVPDTPMQTTLAERIISLSWRLQRIANIQNQTIDALNKKDSTSSTLNKLTRSILSKHLGQSLSSPALLSDPQIPDPDLALGRLAIKDFSNSRVLERLLMYERRLEHSLYKTILEYQRLQLIKKINLDSELQFGKLTI